VSLYKLSISQCLIVQQIFIISYFELYLWGYYSKVMWVRTFFFWGGKVIVRSLKAPIRVKTVKGQNEYGSQVFLGEIILRNGIKNEKGSYL